MQVISTFQNLIRSGLQQDTPLKNLFKVAKIPTQGEGPGRLLHGDLDEGRRCDRLECRGPHLQLRPEVLRHPCAQVSERQIIRPKSHINSKNLTNSSSG